MRRAFVALVSPVGVQSSPAPRRRLEAELEASAYWRRGGQTESMSLWLSARAALPVWPLPQQGGFVIGDLFEMPGADTRSPLRADVPKRDDPFEIAKRLARAHWGQYVALVTDRETGGAAAFRDPTGMIDCLTWSLAGDVEVVASDIARLPPGLRPKHLALNWHRIAEFVAAPVAATTASLLDGVEAVGPGDLVSLAPRRGAPRTVWSPIEFARHSAVDLQDAKVELLRRVDQCTSALVGGHAQVLVELSGGLDSSALAGAISAQGLNDRVGAWLNITDPRPEANEAAYAQAVADRLGVDLTLVSQPPGCLLEADLAELGGGFWPAIAGVDAVRDRDEVARLRALGASGILSGQGGDAAFFQMGTSLVVADEFRRRGLRAIHSRVLPDLARRTHQSVWQVLAEVWAARRGLLPDRKLVNRLLTADIRVTAGEVEHAWVMAAKGSDLPPGKKHHIRGVAINHFNHQRSRRRQEADLLFPFLMQPIVELCLSIPTPDLAGGAFDRPFQREVFADRLPALVRDRRSKGNLSVFFAKLMANSTDMLRPYLLDGALCGAGILDRRLVEAVLSPEHLIWKDGANDLVTAVAAEAWVRHWQSRVPDSPTAPR